MMKKLLLVATILSAASAAPAMAQDAGIDVSANRVTIAAGQSIVPDYIGAKHYVSLPAVAVQGQVDGFSFSSAGTSLSLDLVPSDSKPGWSFQAGPSMAVRLDRTSKVHDAAIDALGKRKMALEPGAWLGVQRTGVITGPYDSLSLSASYQHDVSGAHDSYVVSPSLSYSTPLSHKSYTSLSLSGDYVGAEFGRYYYDVDPAAAMASGLPAFGKADHAGWKDWNASLMGTHSLTGNLTHGWGVFAIGGYSRMLGEYRRSPVVAMAGNPRQWSGGMGLAYTF